MEYTNNNSEYLKLTETWHTEDSIWKAKQISNIIKKNNIKFESIVDIGCGFGEILNQMNKNFNNEKIQYFGYDIAKDAIEHAKNKSTKNIHYVNSDFFSSETKIYDLLLMIDVFEHVPNYIDFIKSTEHRAKYKIFHIPLELHCSAILRNKLIEARYSIGHIHHFSKETALATLKDCGLVILDFEFTNAYEQSKKNRSKLINILRMGISLFSKNLASKLIGGYSLIVLCK